MVQSPPVPRLPAAAELLRYEKSPPDFMSPIVRYHANEEAQDLVWDSWEAPTAEAKFNLLRRALQIFPFSVDALNAWANIYVNHLDENAATKENLEKAEQTYKLAQQAARLLWPGLEQQDSIEWGHIEYRPFLRTYHGLGVVEKDLGKTKEAMDKFRFLLKVNPNDNQGARILLFFLLIEAGEYQKAETIAEQHSEGRSSNDTNFRYGFVLIDFLKFKLGACKKRRLEETLAEALKLNHWVPLLLLGDIPLPGRPQYVSPGSMDEASSIVNSVKSTWEKVAGILEWLRDQRELGGPKPDDDGSTLFDLLQRGRLLVQLGDGKRMELTTKVDDMPGTGLPSFRLAPGMKEHNPSKMVAYKYDEDSDRDNFLTNFTSFPYSDVSAIPFWKILHASQAFGKDTKSHCNVCYEPGNKICGACGVRRYCSAECQRKDWKKGGHRQMCKKFIKQ